MKIETQRTVLRPYEEGDAPLVLPVFSDPTTMAFWPQPLAEEDVSSWVSRNARAFRETGMGRMLVVDRETGEPLGDCGIARAEIDGSAENDLGYIVHHRFWGRGLGTECARAMLRYGLDSLGLDRVVANMPHDHAASIRVAEKLGMTRERSFPNPRDRGVLTHLHAVDAGAADVPRTA